jgi:hypothetical protein
VVAVVSDGGRAKRLFAEAYDASAGGFAASADRLVYSYLARPLARALCAVDGQVLDVAAGSGALGRLLPAVVALDLSAAQLRYNPVAARHAGSDRTAAGVLADELGERVGSPAAVLALLEGAGLRPEVGEVEVDLPWPGPAAFVDYRLATVGVAGLVDDPATVRREAIAAVAALPADALPWAPRLVLGVGRR